MLCDTVLCDTVLYNTMLCDKILFDTILCDTMLSDTMLCNTMLCDTMLCNTVLCDTMLCATGRWWGHDLMINQEYVDAGFFFVPRQQQHLENGFQMFWTFAFLEAGDEIELQDSNGRWWSWTTRCQSSTRCFINYLNSLTFCQDDYFGRFLVTDSHVIE